MSRMLLEREGDFVTSYLLNDEGRALEIRRDPLEETFLAGDIFKARILRIIPGLNAAFACFAGHTNGYLPLEYLDGAFYYHKSGSGKAACGDELLVQIRKLPGGEKLPSLTGKISLAGRYVVLDAGNTSGGVSSKIRGERHKQLALLADSLSDEKAGIVIRTAAEDADDSLIIREAEALKDSMNRILEKAQHAACPSCLYSQPPGWIRRILSLPPGETQEIITDDEEIFSIAQNKLPEEEKGRLRMYEGKWQSMRDCWRLGRERERACAKRIWLSSGAFLVIEPTEALTAIDVNSGKAVSSAKGKKREEYFLKLNMEAAAECAAQIRLRNLSGIIIVDFINMEDEENRSALMRYLQKQLDCDSVKCTAVDMTKLHLAEIARQRKEPPLRLDITEEIKEEDNEE